jgi:hypothetical protein
MLQIPGTRPLRTTAFALALLVPVVSACGDDQSVEDQASDAASDAAGAVDEKVDEGLARGQAEILRERIKDAADGDETLWPTITVIETAVADLPSDPEVTGVQDTDGDGADDDGKIGVAIDESNACVTITADDIDVSGEAC